MKESFSVLGAGRHNNTQGKGKGKSKSKGISCLP